LFPHLVGIADFIFTGTPVATNGDVSAEFIVDEVLWGKAIGRVQCDERKVREIVESIINDGNNTRRLPQIVIRKMMIYKTFRYDWEDSLKQSHQE